MCFVMRCLLVILFFLLPHSAFSMDCTELTTNAKIQEFIKKSKSSNPLFRNNLSTTLQINPCENQMCEPQNAPLREQRKEIVHLIRIQDNKRFFFVKGPNAPQCIVERGDRQFLCSFCSWTSNEQCRSYQMEETTTTLRGTNIDRADFEIYANPHYESQCSDLPEQPGYFKVVTTKKGGELPYDRIVGFYSKEKKVPITVNFFVGEVLKKVYRFYPKYYFQIQGEWISTAVRVRTTQGEEDAYVFETLINVVQDKNNTYSLYVDLSQDPQLKNVEHELLFSTN